MTSNAEIKMTSPPPKTLPTQSAGAEILQHLSRGIFHNRGVHHRLTPATRINQHVLTGQEAIVGSVVRHDEGIPVPVGSNIYSSEPRETNDSFRRLCPCLKAERLEPSRSN